MANAWGELSWNAGNWGNQNDATITVTGIEKFYCLKFRRLLILIKDGVQIFGELRIGVKAET
jgi:hypothetical protein